MKKIIVIVATIFTLLAVYTVSLKVKLNNSVTVQESYKEQVTYLETVDYGDSVEANESFVKSFFNFSDTKLRNEQVKPFMTEKGFQIVQSGSSTEVSDVKVESSASNVKSYEKQVSKTETEFMNELDLTITFNGVSNKEKVFIRTTLHHLDKQGWKVNSIEYLGELNNELVEGHHE